MPGDGTVPALADFSHTFLHCPRVRPAVGWLCALWARIAPSDAPAPVDARVLLLGDLGVWSPAGGQHPAGLWLHMRLLFCRAVWVACAGALDATGADVHFSRRVVSVAAAWLARAIRQD